ncbi:MAG: dTMP kinase [Deltaproteobacteria bacterium]|nr:dTMP kinase [Candidatus Anaeroferrophillus wilburensis]MBN2889773.1 dTMP kinase [Deltaproteobacteria bacterium]
MEQQDPGVLISFEGIEGCGKSTQITLAADYLQGQGVDVLLTREPGASVIGAEIRRLLLSPEFSPEVMTELFLYLADRREHVMKVVRPHLERGGLVLIDRYIDSTWVYQGYARSGDCDLIEKLNGLVTEGLEPQCTILFDCPPEMGMQRARERNRVAGIQGAEDRFDQLALDFHQRVRAGFMVLARRHADRFRILDGSRPIRDLHLRVKTILQEFHVFS